jgi:hypothetical protein
MWWVLLLGLATAQTPDDLHYFAQQEWSYIQNTCTHEGNSLRDINIHIDYDYQIENNVLAWARYTRYLHNNKWIPSLLTPTRPAVDVEIGVSPHVSWSTTCGEPGRSLQTTLLHELLHAMGISSSAFLNRVGYHNGESCKVTLMDSVMKTYNGNPAIDYDTCTLTNQDIYVGGVRLHRGLQFQQGVSLQHMDGPGVIAVSPLYQCARLGKEEVLILTAMGYKCEGSFVSWGNNAHTHNLNSILVYIVLVVFINSVFV